jgi:hypothetical protein
MGLVTSDIVRKGMIVRETDVDRGEMLVYSEQEWRERARSARGMSTLKFLTLTTSIVGLMVLGLFAYLTYNPQDQSKYWVVLVGVFILFTVFFNAFILYTVGKAKTREPAPGLYERGLELVHYIYVPFEEIAEITEETLKGKPALELHLPSHDDETIMERAPDIWKIPLEFLGEEGAQVLMDMVQNAGSTE